MGPLIERLASHLNLLQSQHDPSLSLSISQKNLTNNQINTDIDDENKLNNSVFLKELGLRINYIDKMKKIKIKKKGRKIKRKRNK